MNVVIGKKCQAAVPITKSHLGLLGMPGACSFFKAGVSKLIVLSQVLDSSWGAQKRGVSLCDHVCICKEGNCPPLLSSSSPGWTRKLDLKIDTRQITRRERNTFYFILLF